MAPQISIVHVTILTVSQTSVADTLGRILAMVGDGQRWVWDDDELRRVGWTDGDLARLEELADVMCQVAGVR